MLTELSCEVFESVDRPWESGSPRGRALEDGAVEMEVTAVDCEGSRGFRSSETDGNAWVGLGVTTVTGEMSGKGFCNESSKLEGGLEEDEVVLVLLEDRLWVYGDAGGAGDVGLGWVLKKSSDLNCGMAGSNVGAEDFSDGRTVACGSLGLYPLLLSRKMTSVTLADLSRGLSGPLLERLRRLKSAFIAGQAGGTRWGLG